MRSDVRLRKICLAGVRGVGWSRERQGGGLRQRLLQEPDDRGGWIALKTTAVALGSSFASLGG